MNIQKINLASVLEVPEKQKNVSRIISFFSKKIQKPFPKLMNGSDLNFDKWENLESKKYPRSINRGNSGGGI